MPRDFLSPIKDSLAALRPQLGILPVTHLTPNDLRDQLKQTLEDITRAAEEYIGKKKGKKRGDGQAREEESRKADWMDSEGVSIWNLATQASRSGATMSGGEEDTEVAAAMRLAAFRLVEAATDPQSSPPYIVRLLSMLSKTVSALLSAGDKTVTLHLIGQGAEYATALGSTPFPDIQKAAKEQSSAMLAFSLTRIAAAMTDDNSDLALSILTNAMDLESEGYFSVTDYRDLASTCWSVGNDLRTQGVSNGRDSAAEAIIWLGKGECLVEKMESRYASAASCKNIKIALLRSLGKLILHPQPHQHLIRTARAQLSRAERDSQAFNAAQAVIQSLTEETDPRDKSSLHDLSILQLHTLKQQKAPEGHLRSVIESLIKSLSWDADEVMELLSEIHSLSDYVDLAHHAIQSLLNVALSTQGGHVYVEQIIITTLVSLRSVMTSRSQVAHQQRKMAYEALAVSDAPHYGFKDKAKVIAFQTIIWSTAEKVYDQGNQYDEAARWFKLGVHPAFSELGNENASRCLRKAVLCYVACGDFGSAQNLIEKCPSDEASTQYLRFLSAVQQGREDAALDAVETIVGCADLDGKQLLLMCSLAHDKGLHQVLIKTLSALLGTLDRPNIAFAVKIENITLIRCLVRMTLIELDKTEEKNVLASMLLWYLKLASKIVNEDRSMAQTHAKAVAWLYKTAFNSGVQGANGWDQDITSDLFDAAAMVSVSIRISVFCLRVSWLMTAYETIVGADVDPQLKLHKGTAKFACLCGKLFASREMTAGPEKSDLLNLLGGYLQECRGDLMAINLPEPKAAAVVQMMRSVDVFEVEIMCELKEWESVLQVIEDVLIRRHLQKLGEDKDSQSLETIADLLSSFPDCPTASTWSLVQTTTAHYFVELLSRFSRRQAILKSYSTNSSADITRFARWIRTILLVVFHRSGGDDDEKAERFVVQARDVLRTPAGKNSYPSDEAQWLLAQTWNRGVEFFTLSKVDEAKKWCELALSVNSYIPQDDRSRAKMHDHYQYMLARSKS